MSRRKRAIFRVIYAMPVAAARVCVANVGARVRVRKYPANLFDRRAGLRCAYRRLAVCRRELRPCEPQGVVVDVFRHPASHAFHHAREMRRRDRGPSLDVSFERPCHLHCVFSYARGDNRPHGVPAALCRIPDAVRKVEAVFVCARVCRRHGPLSAKLKSAY